MPILCPRPVGSSRKLKKAYFPGENKVFNRKIQFLLKGVVVVSKTLEGLFEGIPIFC